MIRLQNTISKFVPVLAYNMALSIMCFYSLNGNMFLQFYIKLPTVYMVYWSYEKQPQKNGFLLLHSIALTSAGVWRKCQRMAFEL